ncbi:hypothetical protein CBR_g40250 [Chara braunii]|uniref:Uncharacterized protein n=1 Tax=Chara braunii TaxID=69332 RepID=A0A388K1W3_CHABU|nr:hypothetical protein CBR_g40250 [Chara braunii]|eukprot:GBG64005.1 hypothetical protein CBR_g40250 [Chara braunii]
MTTDAIFDAARELTAASQFPLLRRIIFQQRAWVMEEDEGLDVVGYGGRVWVMEEEGGLEVVGYGQRVWGMEEEEGLEVVGYGGRVWVMKEEEGLEVVGYGGRVWVMEEEKGLEVVGYGGRTWVIEEEEGLQVVGYGGRVWVMEVEEGLEVVGYSGRAWVMEEDEGLEVVGYGGRVWVMEEEGGLEVVGYGGRERRPVGRVSGLDDLAMRGLCDMRPWGGCLSADGRGTTAYGARKEPRRRLRASRSMAWEKLFLIGPMEVNAWTAGSNGPTEMCGVIPEINELVEDTVYLVVELEWRARGEFGGTNLELPGRVRATGSLYLSDAGWRTFGVALADGGDPVRMFDGAWQVTWREGFAFANPDRDDVTATVRVVEVGASILPYENVRMVLPPFLLERMGGVERAEMEVIALHRLSFSNMTIYREYYRVFLELGPFDEEQECEVLNILQAVVGTRPGIPTVIEEVVWEIARREIGCGLTTWEEGELDLGQGSQDGDAQHRKDRLRDTRDTPTRKGKEGIEFLTEDRDRPVNPPLLDSGASRPSASPVSARGCEGLWSLRERVLGWFDTEGIAKPKGQPDFSKEGTGPSSATGPGMVEGGLRKVVSSLTRALSKNQGYLADAKKKLTFDGGNITKFLVDYENLAALLRWTEEEKMEHLGQHVSLNLGRDIMAIVATSGSWKEARDVMMRKYLADEKMATKAELVTVHRKNFATYSDFLREFTLVALRIPGVTDRIMSKYFLKQFTEFDKDKILSAYQQTAKFLNTRDVDFNTITDIAEKMVVEVIVVWEVFWRVRSSHLQQMLYAVTLALLSQREVMSEQPSNV